MRHVVLREVSVAIRKPRNSAIFSVWHAFCNAVRIGGTSAEEIKGELTMTTISNVAQQAFAAVAALSISVLLFANTLATEVADVHSVAGILA